MTDFLADGGSRQRAQMREMSARLEGLREGIGSVRRQAAIDAVSQVHNRASFDEQLEREIDLCRLFGWRGCLILVDIDHFKWVNDHHGHPEMIRCCARSVMPCPMLSAAGHFRGALRRRRVRRSAWGHRPLDRLGAGRTEHQGDAKPCDRTRGTRGAHPHHGLGRDRPDANEQVGRGMARTNRSRPLVGEGGWPRTDPDRPGRPR